MIKVNYNKLTGLAPAIIQDIRTSKVLMLRFMNDAALEKTRTEGVVTFYSRSKGGLHTRGADVGKPFEVIEIKTDCYNDTILIKVIPNGAVCHTGNDTCFGEENKDDISFLNDLQHLISTRRKIMPEGSYTTKLFKAGISKIAQKVGEEAVELVIEAMGDDDTLFENEAADLLYHLLVLLTAKEKSLYDVVKVLKDRHKES